MTQHAETIMENYPVRTASCIGGFLQAPPIIPLAFSLKTALFPCIETGMGCTYSPLRDRVHIPERHHKILSERI
jgi:hypothetical protein